MINQISADAEKPEVNGIRVSVVIPAFNAARFLAETLRSVADQTCPAFETIVVDDGSTDETVQIARSFGASIVSSHNCGPSAARNAGVRAAAGDFIAFLDADDIWLPGKLEQQLRALQALPKPAFSFTDYRIFDENGLHAGESELRRFAGFRQSAQSLPGSPHVLLSAHPAQPSLRTSYLLPSTIVVRRSDFLAVGGFNETLRVTEDYEFHLRLLCRACAVGVMAPLLLYRRHRNQSTSDGARNKEGFLAVAALVAANPELYSPGDVRYFAESGHQRHLEIGIAYARVGELDNAVVSLKRSFRERRTVQSAVALFAAQIARSSIGRPVFFAARSFWKRRPKRRTVAPG